MKTTKILLYILGCAALVSVAGCTKTKASTASGAQTANDAAQAGAETAQDDADTAQDTAERGADTAVGAANQGADTAAGAANQGADMAEGAANQGADMAEGAAQQGGEMAGAAKEGAEAATTGEALADLGKAGITALASQLGIDEGIVETGLTTATGLLAGLATTSPEEKKKAAAAGVKAAADKAKEGGKELGEAQLSGLLEGLQGLL